VLLTLVAALGGGQAGAAQESDGGPGVIVARAEQKSFPLTVEALGTARANESVEIRPQISQTVRAIHFTEGERVAAGAKLVELQDAEALAAVAAARASLVDSESQFRRSKQLYETRAVPESQLQQAAARRDADRAALDAAQARLAETVVRAPFAGRVGLRRVSLGSLVTPATVITTLDDTDTIKLDFDVPETVLSRLESGLPVVARSAAWPDQTFEGTVATVDTRVDPVSRTVTVRALLPNPENRLRPGMFLSVKLLRQDVTALVIPEESVVPEQSRQFVLRLDAEDRVERRAIRTGRRRPGEVEVLEGLAEGDRIIVEGTQKARVGERVRVIGQREAQP